MAPSEVQLEQSLHKVETQSSTFSSLMCSKQQVAALSQLSYPTLTVLNCLHCESGSDILHTEGLHPQSTPRDF